ncbi:hypothetical protein NF701_04985 [Sphingomonadaceae bacterium OTU29THOMA1]|nr:hypothetical protein NF701_04985 [Sphingomonadaceae bacterium OTU29THOMA1]
MLTSITLSACASEITAWQNDPISSYGAYREVADKETGKPRQALIGSIMTTTGDRRAVVNIDGKLCAESMPDAITVVTGSSDGSIGKDGIKANFGSSTKAGILQTYQRTESDSLIRQLGWNSCLAWAQGAIGNKEYYDLLKIMFDAGADVMRIRATQIPVTSANGSLTVDAPQPRRDVPVPPVGEASKGSSAIPPLEQKGPG